MMFPFPDENYPGLFRPETSEAMAKLHQEKTEMEFEAYKKLPIGPDPEIDRLGDAYLLYSRNRNKPMTFSQFVEIHMVDEARVRSWVRLDKVLAMGIKLKMF